jgi:hypothetical protein
MNKPFNIYEFLKTRPLSWSAISSFEYDPEEWYQNYVVGKPRKSNPEMEFGKKVGELLAANGTYLPQVPRLGKYEHPFKVVYNKIPLIGFADTFCVLTHSKLKEFKTGVREWNQKRVDEHGQLTLYCLLNYISKKIKPEDMDIELVWLPTKRIENGNFEVKIEFVEPIDKSMKIFKTKRTMADILQMGARINVAVREMQEYVVRQDYKRRSTDN